MIVYVFAKFGRMVHWVDATSGLWRKFDASVVGGGGRFLREGQER